MVTCPHCQAQQLMTPRVPRDVVVLMPCPACHELIVMFRGKTIAINRAIIENGTFDERRNHLADIIAQCIEAGMFGPGDFPKTFGMSSFKENEESPSWSSGTAGEPATAGAITEEEVERFLNIELHCLDDAEYFRKYFG